jgi:hypothetical protein
MRRIREKEGAKKLRFEEEWVGWVGVVGEIGVIGWIGSDRMVRVKGL